MRRRTSDQKRDAMSVQASTHLSLDVKNAAAACAGDLAYGHKGRAVEVAGELRVLNERALIDESKKLLARDKVVVLAVHFAGAGQAGGV